MYLKVSPIRGTRRFQVRGKLAPRYIGPFPIIKKVGAVAYKLQLPAEMSDVHDVFHVSQLRKCLRVPEEQVAPETIDLQDDLRYQEVPVKNSGHCDAKNPQLGSQDLPSSVEQAFGSRSNLGERRRMPSRVSQSL